MKTISRYLLRLVTGFVPVVIAACYGAPYAYKQFRGKTVDAQTNAAIPGISVWCVNGGALSGGTTSASDGSFQLSYPEGDPCESLKAQDDDGAANGGTYATTTVPFDATAASTTIALQKQ